MGIVTAPPAPARPRTQADWRAQTATTPGRLWLAFGVACVALFALWLVAEASLGRARQAIQSVGRDAVPSIVAAQEIRADMADMDASTVNVFISQGKAIQAVKEQYERDRLVADDRLIAAAQNITYGDAERVPILAITGNLQTYTGLVKSARAKGLPYGIKDQHAASQLMHAKLIPDADKLDQVNFSQLNRIYDTARADASRTQAGLLLAGGFALAVLLVMQILLARHTRRILSLPLILATVLLVGLVGSLSAALHNENELLRATKKDCFDSIHALWKARSVAYDANGDESLYLLGSATAAQYEQSFHEKAALLADVPMTGAVVTAAASGVVPTFQGYLGDELRNVMFTGEHDVALDTLRWWNQYIFLDGQIRALETSGRHTEAVNLCVSTQPGQSNWTFAQFDAALGRTLDINQRQFNLTVSKAFAQMRFLPFATGGVLILTILFTWFGIAPRLREYQE